MSSQPVVWPKAVIFDLDGTLVDSAPDIAASINEVLKKDGLEPFDLSEVRGFIGNGITRLVELAYETRGTILVDEGLKQKVAEFQDVYIGRVAQLTRPYPGAIDLVETLRGQGVKTGICTNKAQKLTDALLKGLGLDHLFDAAVGGSSAIKAKPAADMLIETLSRLGCTVEDALMIGDSETDVACARAAAVPVIGVTFGYTKVPMRELGPDAAIDAFAEAPAAIAGLHATAS